MGILITGITGQDGCYLAQQIAQTGQSVTGLIMPGEQLPDTLLTYQAAGYLNIDACDLSDPAYFRQVLRELNPEQVFHLAAISHPLACDQNKEKSTAVNVTSVEVLVDWQRRNNPQARILTVSSAAVFGEVSMIPQNEDTPMNPNSEYAKQKAAVRQIALDARKSGLFTCCAIAYNHESPRRNEDFVFAKICYGLARIKLGLQDDLHLGNLSSIRDWGYAPEYTTAMAWMLQIDQPTELILATGKKHTVKDIVLSACEKLRINPSEIIKHDPQFDRDVDATGLVGDSSLAWQELGWEATTQFDDLVAIMVDAETKKHRSD